MTENRWEDLGPSLHLEADVLVLGGGPAGTWAAVSAAAKGARIVLADKGYCGTSGATAPSGTGVWYVPPDPEKREAAMASREALGGYLQDRQWMKRVLDLTYEKVNLLAAWGFPFPTNSDGTQVRRSLQGHEYLKLMRQRVKQAGVRILDHSPALELLVDQDGAVGGAAGIRRQTGERWTVRAGAVVVATGGCAYLSKALGCNVLTGDGYLFAAEVGAELSGMEFSNAYALAPAFSSVTKTLFYSWASFYTGDGKVLEGAGSQRGRSVIARTLLTQPVYARLDRATEEERAWMRSHQQNFFLPFDRAGINPFTDLFPIRLVFEGTVRGTGGIRIINEDCATSVPGLYAAGDAATRELICGAFTGGGAYNAAWAITSGVWAGEAAADFSLRSGANVNQRRLKPAGGAALRPTGQPDPSLTPDEVVQAVQHEVFPVEKNLFRTEEGITAALGQLNDLWNEVRTGLQSHPSQLVRAREAAAMTATARWSYASALERRETRGMHKRTDFPQQDPKQHYRLVSGGLDQVWVKPEPEVAQKEAVAL